MSAKAKITQHFGKNMEASLGMHSVPLPSQQPSLNISTSRHDNAKRARNAFELPLAHIVPDPDQPRQDFEEDEIALLAESIKDRGLLQPIRVRYQEDGDRWMIVSGERRYRAALLAGLETITATEVNIAEDAVLEEQIIENTARNDLKPIEQARAFQLLIDRNGWSQRELAQRLRINHTKIARALQVLHLPESIVAAVADGNLAMSTAVEVAKLTTDKDQLEIAAAAIAEKLPPAEVNRRVRAKREKRAATSLLLETTHNGVQVRVSGPSDTAASLITKALRAALKEANELV